ncbi:hypothetical protein [uncultured Oxalicibacterium sp.]|uniref:hypothetical protein n=1 Tax=uncultured Oxalicibacterium sp. TaxID=1168540 RepID=UPI0025DA6165|nr:hypothetical protein [uncultured Oxalicibacterium sp.]
MDLVDKFDAKGKSGEGYHVEVYQDDAAEHAKLYKLKDGRPLEALSDAKFRLVQTGEKIYRL